jgi:hypothetical protein
MVNFNPVVLLLQNLNQQLFTSSNEIYFTPNTDIKISTHLFREQMTVIRDPTEAHLQPDWCNRKRIVDTAE